MNAMGSAPYKFSKWLIFNGFYKGHSLSLSFMSYCFVQ